MPTIAQLLREGRPLVMGVLNITPDSFSDGGNYFGSVTRAVARAKEMLRAGADIIDIGGESTRPGAAPVTAAEEIKRVGPVIKAIRRALLPKRPLISIDTCKAEVARAAIAAGANLVNSVGGFTFDPKLAAVVARARCPIVIYHIKGQPQTMQKGVIRYRDVVREIKQFFKEQMAVGRHAGARRSQYILDPGIGFGKSVAHNVEIIRRLSEFKSLRQPILIGVSRKSHLGKLLQTALKLSEMPGPLERLEAGLAETAVAVLHGARIIRTHDVAETKKFLAVLKAVI